MAKTTAKPVAKTAAGQELPKRNDGIHPPIVESEGIVGEPLRLGKGRGGDEIRGCAAPGTSTPRRLKRCLWKPSQHDRQYLGIVSWAVLIFHIDRARHKREFDGGNDVGRLHDSQFS